jgi:hypothetical protein
LLVPASSGAHDSPSFRPCAHFPPEQTSPCSQSDVAPHAPPAATLPGACEVPGLGQLVGKKGPPPPVMPVVGGQTTHVPVVDAGAAAMQVDPAEQGAG